MTTKWTATWNKAKTPWFRAGDIVKIWGRKDDTRFEVLGYDGDDAVLWLMSPTHPRVVKFDAALLTEGVRRAQGG